MSLHTIIDALQQRQQPIASSYLVPDLWIDFENSATQNLNPYEFYLDRLQAIAETEPEPLVQGIGKHHWTQYATTYNLFPRTTTAFDHNQSGTLEHINDDGWRETGSLLKSIAILPYIQSMGFNTVHLLPINMIGQDSKKGTLGSPYAIRNLYKLDDNLDEPALGLDVDMLFAGFVEAAHRLGMRVVMEFVFRVAAKDSDWVIEHPDWFYWIRDDIQDRRPGSRDTQAFGNPIWPIEKLGEVYWRAQSHRRDELVPPPKKYQAMYTQPPHPDKIHMENGRWIGVLDDGTRVRIPSAFTDWPLEDAQQPWSDVTYLRFYDHPQFNYMAYNTLRIYDSRLAQPENEVSELWSAIENVIPFYQERYGIDGVMLDMGHSLPYPLKEQLMQAARENNPDFAFWGEDFNISRANKEEGYNAVMGYLFFDMHQPDRMTAFIHRLSHERPEIVFFTTPENHNTPRAGSRQNALGFCHQAVLYMLALPGMPFVNSGFELFESHPLNTGVGFAPDVIAQNPPERLPLFSEWSYNWTRKGTLVGAIRHAMSLREQYQSLLASSDPATIIMGNSNNPNIQVFVRSNGEQTLVFVFNKTMWDYQEGEVLFSTNSRIAIGRWGFEGETHLHEQRAIHVAMGGGHSIMFEVD